jgi:hypothetical protein
MNQIEIQNDSDEAIKCEKCETIYYNYWGGCDQHCCRCKVSWDVWFELHCCECKKIYRDSHAQYAKHCCKCDTVYHGTHSCK